MWIWVLSSVQTTSCWSSAASTKGWSTPERRSRRRSTRAPSPASSTPSGYAATSTTTAASATKCADPATTTSATTCATSSGTESVWRAGPTCRWAASQVRGSLYMCSHKHLFCLYIYVYFALFEYDFTQMFLEYSLVVYLHVTRSQPYQGSHGCSSLPFFLLAALFFFGKKFAGSSKFMSSVASQEFQECLETFGRHLQFAPTMTLPSVVTTRQISLKHKHGKWDFNDFITWKTRCQMRTWFWWNERELTQTFHFFSKSDLQTRMQRGARDLQRAGGVQVSVVSRLVCFICLFHVVYGAALLSADVKYAPVWMETPP